MATDSAVELWPEPAPDHPTPGMHIWGWMSPEQLDWLIARAGEMDSIAEVGSLHGRSSFALLTACDGPVYCIDPWDDPDNYGYPSFLRSCGHFPNLHVVRGLSPQACDQVPDVDMVFLDGDHDYDAVIADIDAWLPKARRLLCGHDYDHADYPGVKQAVDERFGDRVKRGEPGTAKAIWYVEL